MLDLRMFPGQQLGRELLVEEVLFHNHPHHAPTEQFDHVLRAAERDVVERSLLVEATLKYDRMEIRVEPQHIAWVEQQRMLLTAGGHR